VFGQSLLLGGDHEIFGGGKPENALPMSYADAETWQLTFVLPTGSAPSGKLPYHYLLREPDGTLTHDWGQFREVDFSQFNSSEVVILDSWNQAGYFENTFYTEPFQAVLLKANHTEVQTPAPPQVTHRFQVRAPLLAKGQTLALTGGTAALGHWDTRQPKLLSRPPDSVFLTADLDLSEASFPVEYKYGVYDVRAGAWVCYEAGANRVLAGPGAPGRYTQVNDGFARLPVTHWKGAGVSVPVFSLRSETSFGAGEFADLKRLADWCEKTGLKLIQILPVNDTTITHTWTDSYPYAAISAFALHPIYLNLDALATGSIKRLLAGLAERRQQLNALEAVDYEAVVKAKLEFVRQVFPSQCAGTFKSQGYRRFFEQNQDWLVPYAAFCYLRDKHGTADFHLWPEQQRCEAAAIAQLSAENSPARDELELNYLIQYHLHLQLQDATDYLHAKGIILKGDIPIGVARHGADVWQQPELYHADMQAGAPPDAFAVKGQNWGFPTYNWPRMQADGFTWWKRRFAQMGRYFDAFRIDHVLGFFRIWSVPYDAVEGILGYFVPALPVKAQEFTQRGIPFDPERMARPYITEAVLQEVFRADADQIRQQFLIPMAGGRFRLRDSFDTQRKIEDHFRSLEPSERNRRICEGLYDLLSNVILLEDPGLKGQAYHFRFAMEQTISFRQLDPHTQWQLKEMYVDYFFRRQEAFWRKQGMEKLPALKQVTNMLICGEDLGLVPACVPEVMRDLGLLSLEVQRMPKQLHLHFSHPKDAPYLSVVTPGTHDMSVVRAWWEEDPAVTQAFYNEVLRCPGPAPARCEVWISQAIVEQHLSSPAMWSIFQLQDLLAVDERLRRKDAQKERINVPANTRNYWRYRMHLTLEELLKAEPLGDWLRSKLGQHGR
jgi:4-alpha-glucanotransferase